MLTLVLTLVLTLMPVACHLRIESLVYVGLSLVGHTGYKFCSEVTDDRWGILWADTAIGLTDYQRCPGGVRTSFGMYSTHAYVSGGLVWLSCQSSICVMYACLMHVLCMSNVLPVHVLCMACMSCTLQLYL